MGGKKKKQEQEDRKGGRSSGSSADVSKREKRIQKLAFALQKKREKSSNWKDGWVEFQAQVEGLGMRLKDVGGDGNCLFR